MTTTLFPASRTLRNIHESKEFAQHAALRAHLMTLSSIAVLGIFISITAMLLPESMKTAPFRGIETMMTLGAKISIFSPAQQVAPERILWNDAKIPVPVTTELPREKPVDHTEQQFTSGGIENGVGDPSGTTTPNGNQPINGSIAASVSVEPTKDIPAEDTFEVFEKDPLVDLAMLQRIIVYPEMARRAAVEGTVFISVYIGADGKAKQTRIDRSANEMLNSAAVQAIMKATFVAAVQDGRNVGCWVSIPIVFKLR